MRRCCHSRLATDISPTGNLACYLRLSNRLHNCVIVHVEILPDLTLVLEYFCTGSLDFASSSTDTFLFLRASKSGHHNGEYVG